MTTEKTHINLAMIGHVDSGKSTITGHLKYKCGGIDKREIEKLEQVRKESYGRVQIPNYMTNFGHRKYEIDRGITIEVHRGPIETHRYKFTLTDTPGHRDFTKNMITGTSQADVALLVVASAAGEFEAGFSRYGQTKEHALLAFIFGIKQLIVCVNKMDDRSVNWSQTRYEEIVQEVGIHLRKIGYDPAYVTFIPVSGWLGDNITEKSLNLPWYTGPCLIEALDLLTPPKRHLEVPLRIPIHDVFKISGVGTVVAGRVLSGVLKTGMLITFTPGNINREVVSIEMHNRPLFQAFPGDIVGINVKSVLVKEIHKGFVVSDSNNDPAKECLSFTAQIIILNHPGQIHNGYNAVVDCHTSHVACRFDYIQAKIDRKTGLVVEEDPRFIKNGDCAICTFVPQKPMCVETFAEYPPMGRFSIRDLRQTIGVGIIKSVQKRQGDGLLLSASSFKTKPISY